MPDDDDLMTLAEVRVMVKNMDMAFGYNYRISAAAVALLAFYGSPPAVQEAELEAEYAVAEVLLAVMHLCEEIGLDFDDCCASATESYVIERDDRHPLDRR